MSVAKTEDELFFRSCHLHTLCCCTLCASQSHDILSIKFARLSLGALPCTHCLQKWHMAVVTIVIIFA